MTSLPVSLTDVNVSAALRSASIDLCRYLAYRGGMADIARPRTLTVELDDACSSVGHLMGAEQAACLADIFKALSDPTRVRLLDHIAASENGTACACHLPETLGISQPTLSHHLKKLVDAGLVTREQRGRWAHYTAVPRVLDVARDFLGEVRTSSDARCC